MCKIFPQDIDIERSIFPSKAPVNSLVIGLMRPQLGTLYFKDYYCLCCDQQGHVTVPSFTTLGVGVGGGGGGGELCILFQ